MASPGKLAQDQVYLGDYILQRLHQLDCHSIFGFVPGDYNLTFLDLIETGDLGLKWIGNANELNAAYAADGYARVKQSELNGRALDKHTRDGTARGLACVVTTFGVGELSAINGIAGAYSERVPVVHIVGVPSTVLQAQKALLHHTLGDGRFNVFEEASKGVSADQAILTSARGATEAIDRVLQEALRTAKPVYIALPTDLVYSPVPSTPLKDSIRVHDSLKMAISRGERDQDEVEETVDFVVQEIGRLWNSAQNPVVLVDACAIRYGVVSMVADLIKKTNVKYFTLPMGKSALPEDSAQGFGGVYVGELTDPDVKSSFESADLVLAIGLVKSDFNTASWSLTMPTQRAIELHSDHARVQFARYDDISFHTLLPKLIDGLERKNPNAAPDHAGLVSHEVVWGADKDEITHEVFWPAFSAFLQPGDIVCSETGTSSFGSITLRLPKGSIFVSQILYGSIGWSTGALLGALCAAQEQPSPRRAILFIGDGSLQLSVQEVATMIRHRLKPIIVVLNNDGYVIERLIHGPDRVYNDISRWRWQELLSFFNADDVPAVSWLASNQGELKAILQNQEFAKADRIQLIECRLGRLDAPKSLIRQAKLSAEANTRLK